MRKSIFVDYVVCDLLGHINDITSRAMFGGHGIYKDGTIFAIIAYDQLYFKVDDRTRKDFAKHDSKPFTYSTKKRKKNVMSSYWLLPEKIMDDPNLLKKWVLRSARISK